MFYFSSIHKEINKNNKEDRILLYQICFYFIHCLLLSLFILFCYCFVMFDSTSVSRFKCEQKSIETLTFLYCIYIYIHRFKLLGKSYSFELLCNCVYLLISLLVWRYMRGHLSTTWSPWGWWKGLKKTTRVKNIY